MSSDPNRDQERFEHFTAESYREQLEHFTTARLHELLATNALLSESQMPIAQLIIDDRGREEVVEREALRTKIMVTKGTRPLIPIASQQPPTPSRIDPT